MAQTTISMLMSRLRPNTHKTRNLRRENNKKAGVAQRRKDSRAVPTLKSHLNLLETQTPPNLTISKVSTIRWPITRSDKIINKTILWRKSRLRSFRNIVWPNLRSKIIWITRFWPQRAPASAQNLGPSLNHRSRDDLVQEAPLRRIAVLLVRIQDIRRAKRLRSIWDNRGP